MVSSMTPTVMSMLVPPKNWPISKGTSTQLKSNVGITAMIAWRAVYLGHDLYVRGRLTDTIPIPIWPFIYVMVLGFFLYCLALLAEHLKAIKGTDA